MCDHPPSHSDDGKSDGTFDPSADQTDPGSKDVVPACCAEDPGGKCCGTWRLKYESGEPDAGGYGGGSMALMFFLGMFSVVIIGTAVIFYIKRKHALENQSQSGEEMSSMSLGGGEASEAEYSAL